MEERTKALLVGVNLNNDPEFETALKELESLAEACNMEVVGVETQNVSQINTGVYVGTGRVEEIKAVAHMMCTVKYRPLDNIRYLQCSFAI